MIHDMRQHKRWRLIYYLRAFDNFTGKLMGHIVDVNTQGLMLVSSDPIDVAHKYTLRLDMPAGDGKPQELVLTVESLWTSPDINTDFHDTGFRLIEPSREAVEVIRAVIDDLHFSGALAVQQGENSMTSNVVGYSSEDPADEDVAQEPAQE